MLWKKREEKNMKEDIDESGEMERRGMERISLKTRIMGTRSVSVEENSAGQRGLMILYFQTFITVKKRGE